MTNSDFFRDALLAIGVLAEGIDPSAEQGETCLRTMNDLAAEWRDFGTSINWAHQTSLTADCPLRGVEATAGRYALALRLCPIYGRSAPPELVAVGAQSYGRLISILLNRALEPVSTATLLPQPEGGYGTYDIFTDQ